VLPTRLFERAVAASGEWDADLITLTGDVIEDDAALG
jgi:hypothetical protein